MTSLLDTVALEELKALSPENPKELLTELVETYMKQAHLEVQNLHIFSQEGKWDEVSKSAHRLKSASFQIGAGRVGELSNEIETTLRLGQSGASLLPLISELRKDYDETLRLLREYLDKLIS